MSVTIHPSQTRPAESRAPARRRLPVILGAAGGSAALLVFAVGAFAFFSDLADPRSRPARIAPVASQWPDLKDGVPALAPASVGLPEARRASLPAAEPVAPAAAPPPAPVVAAAPEIAPPARANLPIEPAPTVPAASRTAAALAPAKVTVPLPPSRSEMVQAKTEQPARFVSLPAKTKPEIAKTEAKVEARTKTEIAKAETAKVEPAKADPSRKPAPVVRNRATEARPTQTASAQTPAARPAQDAAEEPELLGVKIPGGRQIRDGWDAAVNGLLGSKSGGE
ncbi:hypothetical protein [Methylorubrum extorquens]|uniref:hypothetical protein n=1 Tax=Methylorubrum extorquens TaxID=408 RepID=UPI000158FD1A|nr:hypothetical protein Mext_4451 [Methylorubrum extorquens PA1]KQP86514.1 hypothetical protein ASF55_12665 [Methylobacterium sp. Leaf119]WIU42301.1 hypothetical protein KQ926_23015 [Methylorubrum extorquens]